MINHRRRTCLGCHAVLNRPSSITSTAISRSKTNLADSFYFCFLLLLPQNNAAPFEAGGEVRRLRGLVNFSNNAENHRIGGYRRHDLYDDNDMDEPSRNLGPKKAPAPPKAPKAPSIKVTKAPSIKSTKAPSIKSTKAPSGKSTKAPKSAKVRARMTIQDSESHHGPFTW